MTLLVVQALIAIVDRALHASGHAQAADCLRRDAKVLVVNAVRSVQRSSFDF